MAEVLPPALPGGPASPARRGATGRGPPGGTTWRRGGEPLYAALAFGVFAAEGAALGFLAWALLFRRDALSPGSLGLQSVLVGTITITAVCLAVVTGSVVVFRSVSGRREGRRAAEVASWARVWQAVVEDDAACPSRPLPAAAVAALLECREALAGPEAERVAALISSTGVERLLLDRLRDLPATGRRWWSRWVPGASRRLAAALDLLDDLARARLATAVPGLLSLAARPDPALRTMAIRAASRSIAATAPGPERAAATMALLDTLRSIELGRIAMDRAILLLEDAAKPLIHAVLADQDADPALLSSCLDSTGRLGLTALAPEVASRLARAEPAEVRAAALRTLGAVSVLPETAVPGLRMALADGRDIVRTQAARAAYLLPAREAVPPLTGLLGDHSWWVRRAAGESLSRVPARGIPALLEASRGHPDRFAREMADQVLRDAGIPSLSHVAPTRETA